MKNLRQFSMGTGYRNTGFYVRGTGHFIIDRPEPDKFADYCEIFWCIGGCALFYDNVREFRVTPGMVWFYPKNSFHHIIPSPFINYRWLSFDGPDVQNLFNSLRFKPGLNQAGSCPEDLFSEIMLDLRDGSRQSQLQALASGFRILTLAMTPQVDLRPITEQIHDLIHKNFANPEINVSALADLLHIHRITLNRLFLKTYGISPVKYLNNVRLQEGIRLLTETSKPVREIAKLCGYASAGYFTKILHRQTGHTPTMFRARKTD